MDVLKRIIASALALMMVAGVAYGEQPATGTDIRTDTPGTAVHTPAPNTQGAEQAVQSAESASPDAQSPGETGQSPADSTQTPAATDAAGTEQDAPAATDAAGTEQGAPAATDTAVPDPAVLTESPAPTDTAAPTDTPAPNVGTDVHGLPIPLNLQGLAELDALEQAVRSGAKPKDMAAVIAINLNLGDATIYRSGTYNVTGGELRPGGKIIIAPNRVVNIRLNNAVLHELTAGTGVQLQIQTAQVNKLDTLSLGENAVAEWTGNGAAAVGSVTRHATAKVKVTTGSVQMATAVEKKTCHPFSAGSSTAAVVNGEPYASVPNPDGNFYVWLPAPAPSLTWNALEQGGVLEIQEGPNHDPGTPQTIVPGTVNTITQPGLYVLTGAQTPGTQLKIAVDGVTVQLNGVTLAGFTAPLVDNQAAQTRIQLADADLTGTPQSIVGNAFTLQGTGHVGTVPGAFALAPAAAPGSLMISNPPASAAAHQLLTIPAGAPIASAVYEDQPTPFLQLADGRVYLPILQAGTAVTAYREDDTLYVIPKQPGEALLNLNDPAPHLSAGAAAVRIVGSGSITGTATLTGNTTLATMADTAFVASMPIVTADGVALTLRTKGETTLETDGTVSDALTVQNGGSIQVEALSGRLSLTQSSLSGITLRGNIRLTPDGAAHPVLTVLDRDGHPVADTPVTLSLGGNVYHMTTWGDGTLHLWGMGQANAAAAALRNEESGDIYTGIWQGDTAAADPGITFTNVRVTENTAGLVAITFDAPTAQTSGVLYALAPAPFDLPDTLASGAQIAYASGGQVTLGPIPRGQVLSYRLFGAIRPGAQLTADTVDAFSFSAPKTHTMGARVWQPEKSLDVTYTGQPYQLPVTPPAGASLAYVGEKLNANGLPVQVGTYTLQVTIPAGHPDYTPGMTEYTFRIQRIQLIIRPDPNQEKFEGMDDPEEFPYTVSGLLPGDRVTGRLTREPGEDVGNYPFRTNKLSAPDYYKLVIDPDSPGFTILPGGYEDGFDFPFFPGFFEILRPIHQIVVKNDGQKLDVLLNANETLQVNYTRLGKILFGPDDNPRLVSPSLSWNKDTDDVLLRLMADAELNDDKGYKTDVNGRPLWTSRKLVLTYFAVQGLQHTGMDAVSLQNKGAAVAVSFDDLLGDKVSAFIRENGGNTQTARFALTIDPGTLSAADQSLVDAVNPVTASYRVSCQVLLGGKALDITHLLPSLRVSMEMESIAASLNQLHRYDEAAFPHQFRLTQITGTDTAPVDSTLVTPFAPDELDKAAYPALMMTKRYLTAPLTAPGLVQVTQIPESERSTPAP